LFTGHGPYIVGEGNRHVKLSSDNANKWYWIYFKYSSGRYFF
jgi:hypothetical protein